VPHKGSRVPHGPIPDAYFPNPILTPQIARQPIVFSVRASSGVLTKDEIRRQLVNKMREMGLDIGSTVKTYKKPYP
jgi:hypothetical protein